MAGFLTRGQPAAIRQVTAMIAAGLPHALLLVGPRSVGKTTLAADIAAAELCLAVDPADRPCRACRACRLVDRGVHPDVHRLAPDGPGGLIRIGQVRQLIEDMALLPVEGAARVAIFESAHRLIEDAQDALLKTLEEPPSGVTLILCAEDEDRLLPTIQSRVARVRLGTLATRDIEALLEDRGDADAPTAGRLARLSGGRPGLAIAYARAPQAIVIRAELARSFVDLADAGRAIRLVRIRELLARAADLVAALSPAADGDAPPAGSRRRGRGAASAAAVGEPADGADAGASVEGDTPVPAGRSAPAERRRAAVMLLDIWRDTARDLALVGLGAGADLRDPDLLEEFRALTSRVPPGSPGQFLAALDRAGQVLDSNANPELTTDVLALAWPRATHAA